MTTMDAHAPTPTGAGIFSALGGPEAFALAGWIIRWWFAEWGGLRRRLYYWSLRKHLDIVSPHTKRTAR